MASRVRLELSDEQHRQLVNLRDHCPKPYVREKAAALLKMADGATATWVGAHGLLKPHRHRTLTRWAERFLAEGPEGLFVREGRGRKPAFSPSPRERRPGAASRPRPAAARA
jgi:hypothetical protein